MYLKRMEMFGFKSFADKTELILNKGITVIIGPNGCGKSNLVDAIRWALGEQSAKTLRGSRMEELIFSGSDVRKALNFAEVTLTFGGVGPALDLDFEEITVTRRIYRSGESEYLLNRTPCRLKDITELFLDTGAGLEIYSIVGQGRVEEIINSKPEDRREIFEEAAGVLKYKLRKGEAQRRLDETRDNLVRVQDLIFELETQIEPLTEQAETAQRYRDLQGRLRNAERELYSYRLGRTREELARVDQQLQKVTSSLTAATAQSATGEEELQKLKLLQQNEGRRYGELEQKVNRISREMERQENELRLLGERESRYREQMAQDQSRLKQVAAAVARLGKEKERYTQELKVKQEALNREEKLCQQLQEELAKKEREPHGRELEKQQQRIYRALADKKALEASLGGLTVQEERLAQRRENLLQEKAALKEEVERSRIRRRELEKAVKEARENLLQTETGIGAAERSLEKLNEELTGLQGRLQRCREQAGAVESRLRLLQEQEVGLRGYYRGVREIIKARRNLNGIVGPVVDLLTVEERYLRAIEAALGPALQYIVVESEKAALEAVRFLKEKNLGWCTFLPLDTISAGESILERYPQWRSMEGVYGKASELVKVKRAYEKVVSYLLGSILICRDLKVASEAARLTGHRCRIITLEGDLINPGGAIRGGSMPQRHAGLPLGRRRELEKLKQELGELNRSKGDREEQIAGLRQKISGEAAALTALHRQRKEQEGVLQRAEKALQECNAAAGIIEQRERDAAAAQQEAAAEIEELKRRREQLGEQLKTAEEEIASAEIKLTEMKSLISATREEKELEETVTAACSAGILCRSRSRLQDNLRRITAELAVRCRSRMTRGVQVRRLGGDGGKPGQSGEDGGPGATASRKSAVLTLELQEQKKKVDGLTGELVALEERQRRNRKQQARLERRERHLAVEQSRLQTESSYQQDRFSDLFGNEEQPVEVEGDFDAAESEHLIKILREDMEALGVVNLGAIDELARLRERINFLQEQQEDLQQGELSLRRIINEINERMAYYFNEAFQEIGKNLENVFSELFEGGRVMLKLTDPHNLLESGIEIVAQPPGKKLQNISLLSTGEKTLTAVALIFAILQYKPAPFYLLDEVESALDDINLSRFIAYLKGASRDAQFVLITHRRRTMEEADVLYGVTMPEDGVSTLVSLELDQKVG